MSTIERTRIQLRPRRDDDEPFLRQLYYSTRAEEMAMVPWNPGEKEQFLDMQFRAQTWHYDEQYDPAEFFIIELDGRPVGRLYLDRREDPEVLHIIDISLIPEMRGGGIGGMLLREVMETATGEGRDVTIHVEHYNPALRLYNRLGFQHVSSNGVYYLMRWKAGANAPAT
jgi:ribosomal protein S18 acetylase RimI-like enzyme